MTISISGLVSGIDYDSMITELMAIESQPLTLLAQKEASYQSKITGYGSLKSALASFQTTMSSLSLSSKYQSITASVANADVATANATSIAKAGSYSLEVSQLAQAQKLVASGQESASAAIGSGTISIDFGTISGGTLQEGIYSDASFDSSGSGVRIITIDSTNNSLTGIRDAINDAGIGITASIINDGTDTPFRLTLAVKDTGEANSVQIAIDGDSALEDLLSYDASGLQNLTQTSAAQNAAFTVDGIAVSKSSNTVGDVISGVTLTLLDTNVDSPTTIRVSRDTSTIASSVESFVEAYNDVVTAIQDLTSYNKETKEAGLLNGDSTARNIQVQIRRLLGSAVPGGTSSLTRLSQVGVTIQKDGTLSVDDDILQDALTNHFSDFAGLFATGGTVSDSTLTYGGASSSTQPGTYPIVITQMATHGSIAASEAAGLTIVKDVNDTIKVKVDGVTQTITLTAKTYASADDLAKSIQAKINGAEGFIDDNLSVTVSASASGALTISSSSYGSKSTVEITGGNGQANLKLGTTATASAGLNVAGTIDGRAATGTGQTLTATSGDANGISLLIASGSTGSRGTVTYSQGYAYQFDALMSSILDEDDGSIANRIDGLNQSIDGLANEEERINLRLAAIEARYRTQFSALEVLLSQMQTTSDYLTQQLEALADLRKQS